MAMVEKGGAGYRLVFRYGGKYHKGAIPAKNDREAGQFRARVERNLQLLGEGRIEYQPGDDLFVLLLSDGKLNARPEVVDRISLGDFFGRFQANRPPGKERNTAYTEDIHIRHLLRLLGEKTSVWDVNTKLLQEYVNKRSAEKNRQGKPVSMQTVKKELGTLSAIWNQWGLVQGLAPARLSTPGLRYDKGREQPPFQTWEQIERKIARGQPTEEEQAVLWDSLYLSVEQAEEMLEWVRTNGSLIRKTRRVFPWVYPMFAFCAYTGARRSEMLRARLEDFDFESKQIQIREKKKDTSKAETFRHVPMCVQLETSLKEWHAVHPGGPLAFCKEPGEPFTAQMTAHYFQWSVGGGKWIVVKGFHVFRHSFISNLAAKGVGDHVIMALVGHLNRETTKRYLHLRPATLEDAVGLLFGKRPLVADAD